MRRFFVALKTITVGVGFLSMVGCGPSGMEQDAAAYEQAYEEGRSAGHEEGHRAGHEEGRSEVIDCVRGEGGSADDAADSCE